VVVSMTALHITLAGVAIAALAGALIGLPLLWMVAREDARQAATMAPRRLSRLHRSYRRAHWMAQARKERWG